jgi:hypothetical protein
MNKSVKSLEINGILIPVKYIVQVTRKFQLVRDEKCSLNENGQKRRLVGPKGIEKRVVFNGLSIAMEL